MRLDFDYLGAKVGQVASSQRRGGGDAKLEDPYSIQRPVICHLFANPLTQGSTVGDAQLELAADAVFPLLMRRQD